MICCVYGFNLNDIKFIRGEATIIQIPKNATITIKNTYTTYNINNKTLLIIPISYKNKANSLKLCINNTCKNIQINNGEYLQTQIKEEITVNENKVKPDPQMQERIKKEYLVASKAYSTKTKTLFLKQPFKQPLNSMITSPFGTARVFNGVLKSYHSGTDFRANIGTDIISANAGKIVIADDRYYAGKSVIIDHGYGIFSQYYHLNEILVKKGQNVKKSHLIGKSGATGRVSGPHLHFGIAINGISVNPLKFIHTFNKIAFEGK